MAWHFFNGCLIECCMLHFGGCSNTKWSWARGGQMFRSRHHQHLATINALDHPPQHLATMVLSVFESQHWIPPQLPTLVVTVLHGYEETPPQLSTLVASVSKTAGPPPKVLMVSGTEQLPPPCFRECY